MSVSGSSIDADIKSRKTGADGVVDWRAFVALQMLTFLGLKLVL